MSHSDPESKRLELDVAALRERVAQLEAEAASRAKKPGRRGGVLAAVLVLVVGNYAWAQLTTFQPDSPAVAAELNDNFTYLKGWVEARVGFLPSTPPPTRALPDGGIDARGTSGIVASTLNLRASTAPVLDVVSSDPAFGNQFVKFSHANGLSALTLGYDLIAASGTQTDQSLNFRAKGNGTLNFLSVADIGLEIRNCVNSTGISCDCPAGKMALGGGVYCGSANSNKVKYSYPSSPTQWNGLCEDPGAANQPTTTYVICARLR